ncbi:MAG: ApbE family lipoprotein [Segetibacter sp.]|nr:ApbE family lipoprotein [Segetibacter sp.]
MFRYLFIVFVLITCCVNVHGQEKKFSFTREKMASPFTIILYDTDSLSANHSANECFNLVDSFVNIFSDYNDKSELNRLSYSSGSGRFVPVSPALYDIIRESEKAYKLSKGAFDITMGPVIRLWRKARKEKQFPSAPAIAEKMKTAGFDKVQIDTVSKSIKLIQPGMQLDLGGIAQGYIAQKVLERLFSHNIKKALIDVSGDIATGNPPPGKEGWTIGVNLPESEDLQNKQLLLHNTAVSTSGDLYQYIEHKGKRYSHIINPTTGYGIATQKNVTVIANNATTADWLATACSILPVKKAKRLANKLGAEVLVAQIKNGHLILQRTKNFDNFYVLKNRIH